MAINYKNRYPSQIDATDTVGYPYGKARNVVTVGDMTGTPLEADWLNDVLGFFQAIMTWAGTTPNGTPESATASQLMSALRLLSVKREVYTASTTWNKPSGPYSWLRVRCIGGGGGGGSCPSGNGGGGGGESGENREIVVPWASVAASYSVTVGAGGTVGSDGASSSFGSALVSSGGKFGGASGIDPDGAGGAGAGFSGGASSGSGGNGGGSSLAGGALSTDRGYSPVSGGVGGYSFRGKGGGGGGGGTGSGGSGATGEVSNGGGGGGAATGDGGVGGGTNGGGLPSTSGGGKCGAGYGGGGGGANGVVSGGGGGGGGGGWTDIHGAPASSVKTSGNPGVVVIEYW